jgi:hypothetical protein
MLPTRRTTRLFKLPAYHKVIDRQTADGFLSPAYQQSRRANQRQALPREVIDHGKDAEASVTSCLASSSHLARAAAAPSRQ